MELGRCGNRLCRDPARGFGTAHVIAVHRDEFRAKNLRYKNDGKTAWARIFGRIIVGYLDEHAEQFGSVELIVPNPSHSRWHNERVIDAARDEDPFWPFDQSPWALTKTVDTPRSAGNGLDAKLAAARQHTAALAIDASRIRGRRILVYDDVFTTGAQLHEVGKLLRSHGATSVDGLVLARAPWT